MHTSLYKKLGGTTLMSGVQPTSSEMAEDRKVGLSGGDFGMGNEPNQYDIAAGGNMIQATRMTTNDVAGGVNEGSSRMQNKHFHLMTGAGAGNSKRGKKRPAQAKKNQTKKCKKSKKKPTAAKKKPTKSSKKKKSKKTAKPSKKAKSKSANKTKSKKTEKKKSKKSK